MHIQRLILIGSLVLLIFSCNNSKKENVIEAQTSTETVVESPKPKPSASINGNWKTAGNEAVGAHWVAFDTTNKSFYEWGLEESKPAVISGSYQIISDTILQLSYRQYNEQKQLGFRTPQDDLLEIMPLGVGAGDLRYKRTVIDAITFDKVILTNAVDTMFSEPIPKARDLTGNNQAVVDSINAQILATFELTDFEENQSVEFRWGDVKSDFKIDKEVLYLRVFASYYGGAYPNDNEYEYYFDLNSGEQIFYEEMPFTSLFTLSGYLDFLNKYWLPGAKGKFQSAISCAGSKPLCSYYDISNYTIENGKLTVSLTESCFPHVAQVCSPKYHVSVELDSIQQYLNSMGKSILAEKENFSKNPLDKIIANRKLFKDSGLRDHLPHHQFIFGKIDDKYPISMALNVGAAGEISGYYYYDSKVQKLSLKGKKEGDMIALTETVNNQTTGFFDVQYSDHYEPKGFLQLDAKGNGRYLVVQWRNPENTKNFDVIISEFKSTKIK